MIDLYFRNKIIKLKSILRNTWIIKILKNIVNKYKLFLSKKNNRINNKCPDIIKFEIKGINNKIEIPEDSRLVDMNVRIRGNHNQLIISNGVFFGTGCSIWIEGNNCKIIIGPKCTATRLIHINAQEDNSEILIGEDCMLSNNIIIRTSDSHPIYDIETGERINNPRNVVIGNHVWIAPNTKIMKGSYIGNGSIIGSDTTINKKIPENSLAVGRPSKIVKNNVEW